MRVTEDGPFENLTIATLVAAFQVLQMVRERDGVARRLLQDALDPEEQPALEAICKRLRERLRNRRTLIQMGLSRMPAGYATAGRLTGYYGEPGPIVMIQGLQALKATLHGWKLGRDV